MVKNGKYYNTSQHLLHILLFDHRTKFEYSIGYLYNDGYMDNDNVDDWYRDDFYDHDFGPEYDRYRHIDEHISDMYNKPIRGNVVYFWSKNGNITMIKKYIQLFPDLSKNTCVSACCNKPSLNALQVAKLFNQKECVEWMLHDETYSQNFIDKDNVNRTHDNLYLDDDDIASILYDLINSFEAQTAIQLINSCIAIEKENKSKNENEDKKKELRRVGSTFLVYGANMVVTKVNDYCQWQ